MPSSLQNLHTYCVFEVKKNKMAATNYCMWFLGHFLEILSAKSVIVNTGDVNAFAKTTVILPVVTHKMVVVFFACINCMRSILHHLST